MKYFKQLLVTVALIVSITAAQADFNTVWPFARGGTGQVTQQAAIDALVGATTSGQYPRGNGSHVVLSAIQAADVPTLNQNTTGSAGSVAASNITGTTLSSSVTAANITTLPTITTGVWNGTAIDNAYILNPSTTVNGQLCSLGGVCTVPSVATLTTPRAIGGVNFDGSAAITPTQIQPASEGSDNTNFIAFFNSASGTAQQPKYNAGLGYNAATNALTATTFAGALTGNASTVTNGIYTTDTGTVTNAMLAGSIANAKLINQSTAVNGQTCTLGSTCTVTAAANGGNAATVTTNANLTGPITSSGNTTSVASQTGTGSTFMMAASPTTTGIFNAQQTIVSSATNLSGGILLSATAPTTNIVSLINSTSSQSSSTGAGVIAGSNPGAAINSGTRLGFVLFQGTKDASNSVYNSAGISALATENWSGTAGGAQLLFQTTPNTTQTRATAITINQDQSVNVTSTAATALTSNGSISVTTAGSGLIIKSGSNARIGTGTLTAGTVTIANTSVTANTRVFLQDTTSGSLTNVGILTAVTTAGTGFVVTSTLALDTSTFNWMLVESQ